MPSVTTTHQFEQNFKSLSICCGVQTATSQKQQSVDVSSQNHWTNSEWFQTHKETKTGQKSLQKMVSQLSRESLVSSKRQAL